MKILNNFDAALPDAWIKFLNVDGLFVAILSQTSMLNLVDFIVLNPTTPRTSAYLGIDFHLVLVKGLDLIISQRP